MSAPKRIGGPLRIMGMAGLGDTIYMRPLVLNQFDLYDQVFLHTPWPELYRDTDVQPLYYDNLALRCQVRSMDAYAGEWAEVPDVKARAVRWMLARPELNVATDLERSFAPDGRYHMSLPSFREEWPLGPVRTGSAQPLAVIKPNTLRKEWLVPARNCGPSYMARAARHLMGAGYHVVTVASMEDGLEWLDGDPVPCHEDFTHGELTISELCALVESAALCVASPCFLLPLAMAYRTPFLGVLGGNLRHNAPEYVTDPRMSLDLVRWIWPAEPCYCPNRLHKCARNVREFGCKFRAGVLGLEDASLGHHGVDRFGPEPVGLLGSAP